MRDFAAGVSALGAFVQRVESAGRGARSARPRPRRRWSRARRIEARKGGLEVRALVADLEHQHRRRRSGASGASATMRRTRSMPSSPPASASAGSARYSAGSAAMLSLVDVGRVAEDQVVAAAAGRANRSDSSSRDARVEAVPGDVDAGDAPARRREMSAASTVDLRIGHRRDHRQAAVAGAQVEHAPGAVGQPGVERAGLAVGQQLGDVGARHDRRARRREGHVLQPGLAGQVGGGLAGLDAPRDERLGLGDVGRGRRSRSAARLERVERQAERPAPARPPRRRRCRCRGRTRRRRASGARSCRRPARPGSCARSRSSAPR